MKVFKWVVLPALVMIIWIIADTNVSQHLGALAAVGVGLVVYFLPSLIGRQKRNATAIFLLNLFLGWTLLGWVVALVWATTKDAQPVTMTV